MGRRPDQGIGGDHDEKAGKADKVAVAEAPRTTDGGASKYYPGGILEFDDKGRRVEAEMTVVQWQNGIPVTVFPESLAVDEPFWPKR
jgi:branched-chain amino acid transport system substrate-binding protein